MQMTEAEGNNHGNVQQWWNGEKYLKGLTQMNHFILQEQIKESGKHLSGNYLGPAFTRLFVLDWFSRWGCWRFDSSSWLGPRVCSGDTEGCFCICSLSQISFFRSFHTVDCLNNFLVCAVIYSCLYKYVDTKCRSWCYNNSVNAQSHGPVFQIHFSLVCAVDSGKWSDFLRLFSCKIRQIITKTSKDSESHVSLVTLNESCWSVPPVDNQKEGNVADELFFVNNVLE